MTDFSSALVFRKIPIEILNYLRHKPNYVYAISRYVEHHYGSVVKSIDALEECGLIETFSPVKRYGRQKADTRRVYYTLTKNGRLFLSLVKVLEELTRK